MDNIQIINSIKSICQEHDITITRLEETLNMSQGLISRWSKSDPSLNKIIAIADYFKVSLDEVTGYNRISNDKFINKLISQTKNHKIKWNNYSNNESNPKKYINQYAKEMYTNNDSLSYQEILVGQETSFYTCIKNGYISLYSYHEFHNTKRNAVICLFIQADNDSELVDQKYSTKELIPLWMHVLYSLDNQAPDDIKAEILKNTFLLED